MTQQKLDDARQRAEAKRQAEQQGFKAVEQRTRRPQEPSTGDADTPLQERARPPPQFLRFSDLKARQIVSNWPTLRLMIQLHGFPPGILLSPNRRAWPLHEVETWLAARPTQASAFKLQSGNRIGRPRKPDTNKAA